MEAQEQLPQQPLVSLLAKVASGWGATMTNQMTACMVYRVLHAVKLLPE